MHIMHIALGGCLKAPPVQYGLSEDTGGHIAYVLGAATRQAAQPGVTQVDVVTRAFDSFGPDYARAEEPLGPKARILRLRTADGRYLTKGALWAEVPALRDALAARLRQGPRPDLLHAHFADAGEVALEVGAMFGIPVVYTPHSLALDKVGGAADTRRVMAERRIIAQADAIVVSSRDEAERQVPAYDAGAIGRTHRIGPGVCAVAREAGAARRLLAGMLDDPDRPMILAIARPVAKKNLGALVRAYAGDVALRGMANLVILAGQHATADADAQAVLAGLRADGAGLEGRFALPAAHDTRDVAALYRMAAGTRGVFVNPALFEPFGLTLLEAAQAGLPVVATRHGGPSAILGDLGNGRLVEPLDEAGIAAACRALIGDAGEWDRASANGRAGIGRYDWDRYAVDSVRVYAGLRRGARPVRLGAARLLACDIDNTLTGCAPGARAFARWTEGADLSFVVATGRSLPEARAVLRQWELPEPEAFITSVGTEVFLWGDRGLRLCEAYDRRIGASWDRAAVQGVVAGLDPAWQADVDQKRHKISLFGDAGMAARVLAALDRAGLVAQVVHSHDRLIDILPPAAGKAAAIAAVAARYGLGLADCIAAGDSGNDFDMLDRCGAAIVVANASAELAGLRPRAGLMRVGQPFARGVLEGLERIA
ncbi:HAD-IIB family hydrolase [Falsirhodobacter sp. 20TX0035]|uniref:HAD-IIB family hydrolase n=1 Tax=Falsirhodobacter sp. 20TX0035 TaxID=3022019 RepID=UPI00232C2CB0|nr:HAD-IIB family hydrolase [Falsirhodobacter sp. 20TX0035]MDB6452828.1 HAD-IIB family hydrolase [Falsirhodobacter sp. 20TX0035]